MFDFDALWKAFMGVCAALFGVFSWHVREGLRDAKQSAAKAETNAIVAAAEAKQAAAEAKAEAFAAQRALSDHKLYASENYVRQPAFAAAMDRLDGRFDRLTDDLDEIKGRLPPRQ